MKGESNLKREHFAISIRRDQRERKIREIREAFNKLPHLNESQSDFQHIDITELRRLKDLSRKSYYAKNQTQQLFSYLFTKNVVEAFGNQNNLKFVKEVIHRFSKQEQMSQWEKQICAQVKDKLLQLITIELNNSPKDEKGNFIFTNDLSELHIFKYFFSLFIQLITWFPCFFGLWQQFSLIKNKELRSIVFNVQLKQYLKNQLQNFHEDLLPCLVSAFENLSEGEPSYIHDIICFINQILHGYELSPKQNEKIVGIMNDFLLENHIHEKIDFIIKDTKIYQNLTAYLDRQKRQYKYTNFHIVTQISRFVFNMFKDSNEKLCEDIMVQNMLILSYLRSWLPVVPNITPQMIQNFGNISLTHTNHLCTQVVIAAISNILASGYKFAYPVICTSDMYRAILVLYKCSSQVIKQEISHFFRCAIVSSNESLLKIMIEQKLPQILTEMMKQTRLKIQLNAIQCFVSICRKLQEQQHSAIDVGLPIFSQFKHLMESFGFIKIFKQLINSADTKMSQIQYYNLKKEYQEIYSCQI